MKYFNLLFILFLFFTGCEDYNQDSYSEYVVVESYAVANNSLPDVRVTETKSTEVVYNPLDVIITNADVQVVLLDSDGNDEQVFEYVYSEKSQGRYIPVNSNHKVLPRRTYRLDVSFEDRSEIIHATTTVPDDFEILNVIPESLIYQSEEQLEIILSETERTQSQNVFVFTAIALEPKLDNLTPFYRATLDNDDAEIEDYLKNSSGLINEGNFEQNPDGTITLQYPWLGIAFYGENLIITHSVDENILDLVRSQQVQLGGSTFSPGEIPNLIYQTEGGLGIFGSLSADTVSSNFLRP